MSTLSNTLPSPLQPASGYTRLLIHFPILHTQQDLGNMGESARQVAADKWGEQTLERNRRAIEQMWLEIDQVLEHLPLRHAQTRVYQDGLPVCGHELAIVTELAAAGSHNHRLLLQLHAAGATLMGTEAPERLLEEYQLMVQTLQGPAAPDIVASRLELGRQLLHRRDESIARRINQTLGVGETGIVFLGMLHSLREWLAPDINVIYPAGQPNLPKE